MEIQTRNGILLVDSRLITEALGIQHKTLKETISRYSEKLESLPCSGCNPVSGESRSRLLRETTSKLADGSGGESYYLLTEEQSTFIMTLSGNTEQVVEAKFNLVKAFSVAKQALYKQQTGLNELLQVIQQMATEIQQQRLDMQLLTQRTQRLDELEQHEREFGQAAQIHPGCAEILIDQIETAIDDEEMTAYEFVTRYGINPEYRHRISIAAGAAQRFGKQVAACPKQPGSQRQLYEIRYLKQAAKTVLKLN